MIEILEVKTEGNEDMALECGNGCSAS